MTTEEALKQAIKQLNEISEMLNDKIVAQLGKQADWGRWAGDISMPSDICPSDISPDLKTMLETVWEAREGSNGCINWIDNHLPPEEMKSLFEEF